MGCPGGCGGSRTKTRVDTVAMRERAAVRKLRREQVQKEREAAGLRAVKTNKTVKKARVALRAARIAARTGKTPQIKQKALSCEEIRELLQRK